MDSKVNQAAAPATQAPAAIHLGADQAPDRLARSLNCSDKLTEATLQVVTRLRSAVPMPLSVQDEQQVFHPFTPQVGVGVVTVETDGVTPMEVINQAERRALATVGEQQPMSEHDI